MSPLLVAIAGGTASGKTTIAEAVAASTGAALVAHDRYYRDVVDPSRHDFDDPAALDTDLLVTHLVALRRGEPVSLPVYDFARHARSEQTTPVVAAPVVIVEGILALADPRLRDLARLRVYVHADDDVRLARRIRRDVAERGRTWDDVIRQWLLSVRPAHQRFVAPCRDIAELVLDGEAPVAQAVAALTQAFSDRRSAR